MFSIIGQLDEDVRRSLLNDFRAVYKKKAFTADVSNYAKGREKVWIHVEAPLVGDNFTLGYQDLELYKKLKNVLPDADLFLIHRAIGIRPHRDASSLSHVAYSIQLSGKARFLYSSTRAGTIDQDYPLQPGWIFKFNSKHQHGSTDVSSDRLAISAWKAKPEHLHIIRALLT